MSYYLQEKYTKTKVEGFSMEVIDFIKQDNRVFVTLPKEIYVEVASELREKSIKLLEDGEHSFSFDFKHVEYIDSSGLGVLVGLQKKVKHNGGDLKLFNVMGTTKEIFEMTRLTLVFNIE